MDSRLKGLSIESNNTKFGVLMKELFKLQAMKKISYIAAPIAAEDTVFHHFGPNMSSNCINLYMDGF